MQNTGKKNNLHQQLTWPADDSESMDMVCHALPLMKVCCTPSWQEATILAVNQSFSNLTKSETTLVGRKIAELFCDASSTLEKLQGLKHGHWLETALDIPPPYSSSTNTHFWVRLCCHQLDTCTWLFNIIDIHSLQTGMAQAQRQADEATASKLALQRSLQKESLLRTLVTLENQNDSMPKLCKKALEILADALGAQELAMEWTPANQKKKTYAVGPKKAHHIMSSTPKEEIPHNSAGTHGATVTREDGASLLFAQSHDHSQNLLKIAVCHPVRNGTWHYHEELLLKDATQTLAETLHHVELHMNLQKAKKTLEQQAKALTASLEKELQLNALQGEFISMASHEFLTPLAIIDGACQLIQRNPVADENAALKKQLDKITRSSRRLSSLVNSTLQLSRMQEGRLKFEPTRLCIQEYLHPIIERLRAFHPNHTLSVDLPKAPIHLAADPTMLDHMISNLLENAAKYSPPHSTIQLGIEEQSPNISISIKDEGDGIPVEDQPRLFEKFFRASNAVTVAGTGIGLYLVKYFVELHQGSITVESREHEGTCFTLTLPTQQIRGDDNNDKNTLH